MKNKNSNRPYINLDMDSKVVVKTIPRQKPTDSDCAMRKKNCFIASNKLEQPDFSNLSEIFRAQTLREIKSKKMSKVCEIAKIIINKYSANNVGLPTLQLEKLLVLIQNKCINYSGYPLFSDPIEVIDSNVMIKEIEDKYRVFNSGQVCECHLREYITLLDSEIKYIDDVLSRYGHLDTKELNDICLELPICQTKEQALVKKLVREKKPNKKDQ